MMDPQEIEPLESGIPRPQRCRRYGHFSRFREFRDRFRGPYKMFKLMGFLFIMPVLFLLVPLYLRFRVYSGQMYPMSMTDMRLIDSKISPTWCQRQVVRSNTTFNAFVVPGPPSLTDELVPVSMTRQLELEDDMKEYWGFYLLKGSTVTVSACVRWPGASLIMIKGYKHLHECAYIGDDSSEELDELIEANKLGLLSNESLKQKIQELKKVDGKANNPGTMKRHKSGVSFHDPSHVGNMTSEEVPTVDETDHDPKELREILERLHALREAAKAEAFKNYRPPAHLMNLPALHRHRDANVDIDERKWLSFTDIDGNNSDQKTGNINLPNIVTTQNPYLATVTKMQTAKQQTSRTVTNENDDEAEKLKVDVKANITSAINDTKKETVHSGVEEKVELAETMRKIETDNIIEDSNEVEADSKEVFIDVLKRLQALGDRGKSVLVKLHQSMGVEYEEPRPQNKSAILSAIIGSSDELDRLRQVIVEAIDEEKTRTQRQQRRHEANVAARAKRELMLGQIELQKVFNEDDEARDYAAEEGLEPDGYAEHHEHINETTALDMSNSEFWSSFSSSEEALLACEGLILNLPLATHSSCTAEAKDDDAFAAARGNALTYRVPANGYYFFVFNSENEVQRNYIRARFDLQKTRYDVARTALRECRNSTERCDLLLDIFSSQKVVLEVPLRNNDSLWNEQFLIISECEPRASVYLVCLITVPLLIMVFGFQ